jgi:5'-3' exonuclease
MSIQPESLLLIDALNLIRRVYEANPAPDSPDKLTSARGAILGSLGRALREHPSDKVVAVFDVEGETWRHRLYSGYKAGRNPMPQALRAALPELKLEFNNLGAVSMSERDVDADDVIASLAVQTRIRFPDSKVRILSTDKDMLQLLPYGVEVYDHFSRLERTADWVQEKFGVTPAKFRDFQALVGDAVDGIPGVPRVGSKTAADWLARFGSVSEMLRQLEDLEPKIQTKVKAGRADLEMSLQLVTLVTTLDLKL